jgi:hypothetical protein
MGGRGGGTLLLPLLLVMLKCWISNPTHLRNAQGSNNMCFYFSTDAFISCMCSCMKLFSWQWK